MYHTFLFYWLLVVITKAVSLDEKYQFKPLKDSFSENVNSINQHVPKGACSGWHNIKSNIHQIKNYPEVIIT